MAILKESPSQLSIRGARFTTIPNDTLELIKDPVAGIIWVYLMSKSENWIVRNKDIQNRFGIGRDKVHSSMKYLRGLGLVWDEVIRGDSGVLKGKLICVSSTTNLSITEQLNSRASDDSDATEPLDSRSSVNPNNGKHGHLLKDLLVSKDRLDTNTPISPKGESESLRENSRKKVSYDTKQIIDTWNQKADKHGLPRIRVITDTTAKRLKKFYDKYKRCQKELGKEAREATDIICRFIDAYEPSPYALGQNPSNKKHGIEIAFVDWFVDQELAKE